MEPLIDQLIETYDAFLSAQEAFLEKYPDSDHETSSFETQVFDYRTDLPTFKAVLELRVERIGKYREAIAKLSQDDLDILGITPEYNTVAGKSDPNIDLESDE